MKKISKIQIIFLMAAVLVIGLAACGNNGGAESKVSGKTYVFESYTVDGEDNTAMMTALYSEQSFSFKEDGICVQTIRWTDEMAELMGSTDPVEMSGTYEEKGDTVKVTFQIEGEGDTVMEFTIGSDTIQLEEEGISTVYRLKANS